MTGINRHTGQPLEGFDHVIQSLEMIFEIPFGSLPLQRDFGLNWPMILGRLAKREHIIRFWALIATTLSLEEPRFTIQRFLPGQNSVEAFRSGAISFVMEGVYRPRAQLGDMRPERTYKIGFRVDGETINLTKVSVTA